MLLTVSYVLFHYNDTHYQQAIDRMDFNKINYNTKKATQ